MGASTSFGGMHTKILLRSRCRQFVCTLPVLLYDHSAVLKPPKAVAGTKRKTVSVTQFTSCRLVYPCTATFSAETKTLSKHQII